MQIFTCSIHQVAMQNDYPLPKKTAQKQFNSKKQVNNIDMKKGVP